MRENIIQGGKRGDDGRLYIDYDWYTRGLPANVQVAADAYLDTSYGFAFFQSEQEEGFRIGEASGCYDRASFVAGRNGRINVGKYVILNGTTLISNCSVTIGDHCMLAWGSVVTDSWLDPASTSLKARQAALRKSALHPLRPLPIEAGARPVVLEENCWVGFESVILPGVTLGRSCLIGSKTVIAEDVPAYAIVAGSPARIIRYFEPDDTEDARQAAFREYTAR